MQPTDLDRTGTTNVGTTNVGARDAGTPDASTPDAGALGRAATAATPTVPDPAPRRRKGLAAFDARARSHLARLAREELRGHWPALLLAVLLMAASAGATTGFTFVIERVVNDVLVAKQGDLLPWIAGALLALGTIKGLAVFGHTLVMNRVGLEVVTSLQQRMFARVLGADLAFFTRRPPGVLISRFTNDLNMLRAAVQNCVIGLGRDIVGVVALTAAMFWHDWLLALIASVIIPVAVLPIARLARRMRKAAGSLQDQSGRLVTLLDEAIRGARQVKAYGMEGFEHARFLAAARENLRLVIKVVRTRSAAAPIMEALTGLGIAGVIVYGGNRVIDGDLTQGGFVAFLAAAMLTYQPLRSLSNLAASLQEGVAALERVHALLDELPEIVDRPGAVAAALQGGPDIRFERVSFRYAADRQALSELDLVVPACAKVALVGPSGAGKSTILNLIPRFYDVADGRITVGGVDLRDLTLASLRAGIALVSQDVVLFDDTVRANIAYGRPSADAAAIEAAARAARAHDFIMALPQGYDTPVGPRGQLLSGGQAQRVSIARAMLKDAPILLLDEATSNLDTESERHIQAALKTLMHGRTTVVIAHRLSTIVDADVIYVIDGGRCVERGTHAELLARGGAYARLVRLQGLGDLAAAE